MDTPAPAQDTPPDELGPRGRFDRQVRFAPFGAEGQKRLERSRVLLVGCGALGGVLAQNLVRAGVGALVLVDRDIVELSNLPRQVLFGQTHADEGQPKAQAALEALAAIGGPTELEAHATHVDARNVEELARGCDLLLDGTDNLETRYLLNDYAVRERRPWVYAGVVGGSGLVLPILPGQGACLRCVFPEPPPPGTLPTCDTAGVLVSAVSVVAGMAAGLGLRILAREDRRDFEPALIELDAWNGAVRRLVAPRDEACPACARGTFPYLENADVRDPVLLCGRNTVQVPAPSRPPELELVARNLPAGVAELHVSKLFLRFTFDGVRWTLFRDGRALLEGLEDADRARSLYDRLIGT